jgi:hypothetical protein
MKQRDVLTITNMATVRIFVISGKFDVLGVYTSCN